MTRVLSLLAVVVLLASCGRPSGLRGPLAELRAEIQDLERTTAASDKLWPDEGDGAFNKYVEDNTPRIPDFIYDHVVGKLKTMSEAQVDALAVPAVDLKDVFADPPAWRGKLIRITGRIGHLAPERQAMEASSKPREVFAGTLFNGDQPVHFHVVNKPDVVYLGSDEVDFIGVFIKVLGYPKPGEETVSAPFFIAKTLRKYY